MYLTQNLLSLLPNPNAAIFKVTRIGCKEKVFASRKMNPFAEAGDIGLAGSSLRSRENFARGLNQREGFKSSDALMCQWLENLKPYMIENGYVVIGPLKDGQYEHLKTVTFYVNPDQLSLLLLGAEYNNASIDDNPVRLHLGPVAGKWRRCLVTLIRIFQRL